MFKMASAAICLIAATLFASVACAQTPTAAGLWQKVENGRPVLWVLITEDGGVFQGVIAKTFPEAGGNAANATCDKCTDDRKNQPVLGLSIMRGMKQAGLRYSDGSLLDPRDGKIYKAGMNVSADGRALTVRGYFGLSLLGSDDTWSRLPDTAIASLDPVVIAKYLPQAAAKASRPVLPSVAAAKAVGQLAPVKAPVVAVAPVIVAPIKVPKIDFGVNASPLGSASYAPPPAMASAPPAASVARAPGTFEPNRVGQAGSGSSSGTGASGGSGGSSASLPSAVVPAQKTSTNSPGADALAEAERQCREKQRSAGIVSTAPCVDIDDIVSKLRVGNYTFNKPDKAFVGDPLQIALVLQTTDRQTVADVFESLPGATFTLAAKFSRSVEATLSGQDFKIDPPGAQARTATTSERVEWSWTATPQTGGKKTLTVAVNAIIQVGPEKHTVLVQTLRQDIKIDVSMFQQVKAYVSEANGVVLAAAGAIPALAAIIAVLFKIGGPIGTFWRTFTGKLFGRTKADAPVSLIGPNRD